MRAPTKAERLLLKLFGYVPWGFGHWVHKDSLGTVLETEQALEHIYQGGS